MCCPSWLAVVAASAVAVLLVSALSQPVAAAAVVADMAQHLQVDLRGNEVGDSGSLGKVSRFSQESGQAWGAAAVEAFWVLTWGSWPPPDAAGVQLVSSPQISGARLGKNEHKSKVLRY